MEEYLRTSYRPDCDYVDGEVQERNLGERDHAKLQIWLGHLFLMHAEAWQIEPLTECRYQVSPTRFRIPDLAVTREGAETGRIIQTAPVLCIEILSPEDTWKRIESRIADYLDAGVQCIWVFDPEEKTAFLYGPNGRQTVQSNEISVPGTAIRFTLEEVFRPLNKK